MYQINMKSDTIVLLCCILGLILVITYQDMKLNDMAQSCNKHWEEEMNMLNCVEIGHNRVNWSANLDGILDDSKIQGKDSKGTS